MMEIILELAEGNPGAITVLSKITAQSVADLRTLGIYGSDIWGLYKAICEEDMQLMEYKIAIAMIDKQSKEELIAEIKGKRCNFLS